MAKEVLDGIPRIDKRTDLHGIDLWTGCQPCLDSLTVVLYGATSPITSDEDGPLGILASTTTHQAMRFDGLADKRIHHGIKDIVREIVHHLETHFKSQFLKFAHVQLL